MLGNVRRIVLMGIAVGFFTACTHETQKAEKVVMPEAATTELQSQAPSEVEEKSAMPKKKTNKKKKNNKKKNKTT